MTYPRRLFKAAVLATPLGAVALSAQAADIVGTIKDQEQFSKLAEAMEQAGIAQSLQGGPYTVFAPTDQAFEQLPQGTLDELMKEENRDQLETLLQYHVLEGEELMAKDVAGEQTEVDTLAGDSLSVDGSGQAVLLMATAPTSEIQTEVTEQGGMPASEHQQQALGTDPATEQQQTASQGGDMPSSPHQEQVLRGEQPQSSQQDTGMLREATVIEPDIQADNGIIHAIDAVLVPQSVLLELESMGQEKQSQGQSQQSKAKQG
jgi:uncharacterized surface protein with fasciclin (FAS1) repeats